MSLARLLIIGGSIGVVVSAVGLIWGLQRRKPKRR